MENFVIFHFYHDFFASHVYLVPRWVTHVFDAIRGQSVGTNCLLISFFSFEKNPKMSVLKRPPRGQKNKFSEKLTKSDFSWQNRVCRGQISGIGTKNVKNCRKLQILWNFKNVTNLKIFYVSIFIKIFLLPSSIWCQDE